MLNDELAGWYSRSPADKFRGMSRTAIHAISDKSISEYQENGVVVLRGIFSDWMPALCRGADTMRHTPAAAHLFTAVMPIRVDSWKIFATGNSFPNFAISY